MKIQNSLSLILFFCLNISLFAQTELIVNQGNEGAKLSIKALKHGRTYQLKFDDLHPAIMSLKSKSEALDLVSTAPDILKYLSIQSTADIKSIIPIDSLSEIDMENQLDSLTQKTLAFDKFYKGVKDVLEEALKDWSQDSINRASLKASLDSISVSVFERKITKEEVGVIQLLNQQTKLWAIYLKEMLKTVPPTSDAIDLLSRFFLAEEQLQRNYAGYIKSVLVYHGVSNPSEGSLVTEIAGEKVTVKGDYTRINYAIQNKLTADTLKFGTLELPTYGNVTFDFSTGFYWNQLTNDSYTLTDYNSDSTLVTFQQDYNKSTDIALGAQLHTSYIVGNGFGLGLNTGAAVSMYDGSTKYLLGGHVRMFNKNQLILSVGVSIGKVKRLSDALINDPDFSEGSEGTIVLPAKFAEPKMVDKVECSFFIGLSYNLSGVFKKIE